ncbi:MAG: permease-like cell division protein FtsX [Muribaculaceae bacterium]|nr:permease-like cell division protein FtsX [Muribaculaceae bacterium]
MTTGKRSTSWHAGATLTTVFSVAMVLLLAGVMMSTAAVASRLTRQVQESASVTLSIANSVPPGQLDSLSAALRQRPYAARTQVETRAQALEQWKEETGEDLVELLGENPLNATIEVFVKAPWASADSLAGVKAELEQLDGVTDASTSDREVENIMDNTRSLMTAIAVLTVLMLAIAVALIMSVVRLHIHSQRFTIHTMTLVGATAGFIARPFVLRGAVMGAAAAVVSSLTLVAVTQALATSHDPLYHALGECLGLGDMMAVCGVLLVLGMVLAATAAGIAVLRHVRSSHDELYG